jgi:hypothetical protein
MASDQDLLAHQLIVLGTPPNQSASPTVVLGDAPTPNVDDAQSGETPQLIGADTEWLERIRPEWQKGLRLGSTHQDRVLLHNLRSSLEVDRSLRLHSRGASGIGRALRFGSLTSTDLQQPILRGLHDATDFESTLLRGAGEEALRLGSSSELERALLLCTVDNLDEALRRSLVESSGFSQMLLRSLLHQSVDAQRMAVKQWPDLLTQFRPGRLPDDVALREPEWLRDFNAPRVPVVESAPDAPSQEAATDRAPDSTQTKPAKGSSRKHTIPYGVDSPLKAFAVPALGARPILRAPHPVKSAAARSAQPVSVTLTAAKAAQLDAPGSDDLFSHGETELYSVPVPPTHGLRYMIAGSVWTLAVAALVFLAYSTVTSQRRPKLMSVVLPRTTESAEVVSSREPGNTNDTVESPAPTSVTRQNPEGSTRAPSKQQVKTRRAAPQAVRSPAERPLSSRDPDVGF